MGTIKSMMVVAALATGLGGTAVTAGKLNYSYVPKAGSVQHLPPAGYVSQWWVHPSGCEYSRAGRPGEIVWYVIINSIGKRKCPRLIVQQALDGAYDDLVSTN